MGHTLSHHGMLVMLTLVVLVGVMTEAVVYSTIEKSKQLFFGVFSNLPVSVFVCCCMDEYGGIVVVEVIVVGVVVVVVLIRAVVVVVVVIGMKVLIVIEALL